MTDKCAWIITLGQHEAAAQAAAAQLANYGLPPKGQRWATDANGWIASAQEAAQANAAIVLVVGNAAECSNIATRRQLALFRLALQTHRKSTVNGIFLPADSPPAPSDDARLGVLDDWLIASDNRWPAKAVARAHAPINPPWPARLGVHAQERLGVWLEAHPAPEHPASGALLGVAGNGADISFQAVGPEGGLPEKTVNEFALEGLKFEAGGQAFNAWALQNTLSPHDSHYVRIEGEPDWLAIGTLPNGEAEDVHLIRLG